MRAACLETIYELAKRDDRIVYIGSDVGSGTLEKFRRELPDRFLMEGINEQAVVGIAAGLALEGRIVYVNTIATFLTRRCFEQIVLDLGLHGARVRLIGMGGGLVYAPLGPTHLATDDIAIMRTVPGMAVLVPADAPEMRRLLPVTVDYPGPVYVSVGKGGDPVVTPESEKPQAGKALWVRPGRDAVIVTTGICLAPALAAAEALGTAGIDSGILHVPWIKPFDTDQLLQRVRHVRAVVTVEERSLVGGLGSAVAEILAESGALRTVSFARIGLPDAFPEGYGSQKEMMVRYGITAERIAETVGMLAKRYPTAPAVGVE
jgi:transketolase